MAIHNFYSTASIAVFVLCFRMGISNIVVNPSSGEVQLGGSTYFNCSTSIASKEIHWFHYPVSATDRSFVYGFDKFYSPYLGRFAMDKNASSGEYNLVITSVVAEDAGKYECQDEAGGGMKKSAHLIILDTDLVCQSNVNTQKVIGPNACEIKPDQLILTCMAQYHGNEAPILLWAFNYTNESITNGVTRQINGNRVIYNLTMTTDELSNGSFYVCQTTRSTSKISCSSGNIKVVGSSQGQGVPNGDSNCKPCEIAVYCICFLLLLPLSISVILLCLKLRGTWKPKLPGNLRGRLPCTSKSAEHPKDRENQQLPPTMQSTEDPTKAKTSEMEPKPTKAADVKEPLLSARSGDSSNGLKSKIKALENEVSALQQSIQRRNQTITEGNQTIHDLRQSDKSNKAKIHSLQLENDQLQDKVKDLLDKVKENDQLQAKVKDLELRLYPTENIDYLDKPGLAHTIELSEKNKGKSINGIAVLGNELFIVTKCSQEIEVYDSTTFKHERDMEIREMTDPLDIASSKDANCLYIVCRLSEENGSRLVRLDLTGKVLHQWPTGGSKGRLSTYGSNVILCLSDKQLINEYSPDGELIVTVRLSPAAKLNNPLHAIKVTSTFFVVSHGDINDELHRVCVVDLDGEIKRECKKWKKSKVKVTSNTTMKVPICLVEDNERSIIVADLDRKRILLVSSMLKYQRKLIEEENGLKDFPSRLCFDDTQSRLFVAVIKWNSSKKEWEGGPILVFNIK